MPIQAHTGPPEMAQASRPRPIRMRPILSMLPTFLCMLCCLFAGLQAVACATGYSKAGRLGVNTVLPAACQASKPPAIDCTCR
ncbi:hypothetical protein D3C78_1697950 [compost metagenome]